MTSCSVLWPRMIVESFAPLATIQRITHLTSFGLALCCLLLSAQIALAGTAGNGSHAGGTWHYYCTSNQGDTLYFSAAFDVTAAPGTAKVDDSKMGAGFKQTLAEQYGYDGPVVCFGDFKTLDAAQTGEQKRIDGARASNKWKVVETGWTYNGAPAAGNGASEPAASAPTAASAPASSAIGGAGPSSSAGAGSGPGQGAAAGQAQNLPAVGTTLAVRILEAVDSSKDPAGKQYRGMVLKPADAGNGVTIPQGSMATVTLMKAQGGWSAHLQLLMFKGQTMNVSSAPASVMGSTQSSVATAASTVTSALGSFGGFGHKPPKPSGVEAIATGDRVVLPPGTQVQFVLSGASAPSGGEMPSAMGAPSGGGIPHPGGPLHPGNASGGAHPVVASNSSAVGEPVTGGALTAKIQETLLGPSKQSGLFVVSPDGGHYAVSSMHGSRELVIVDGVDGPEFDHAAHAWGGAAIDVVFSSDGKHSAYVGQRGDDLVEVRDGKDAFVVTSVKLETNGSVSQINQSRIHNRNEGLVGHQCLISPSGANVAVVSAEYPRPAATQSVTHDAATGSQASQAATTAANAMAGFHMFLDGVKSPVYATIDLNQIAFVGEKLVYAAQTQDQKWHMVVNDKPGPGYDAVGWLQLNEEDKHYAFIASTGGGQMVVTDGVPGPVRMQVANGLTYLTIASNGRVAYLAYQGSGPTGHSDPIKQVLYVDEKEVSPEVSAFAVVDPTGRSTILVGYMLFSPDGKRFAYAKPVPGGIAAVIDGKVGRAYDTIGVLQFSPDSKHDFYVGNRTLSFMVVDGQEMPGQGTLKNFVYSREGGRLGYEAYSAQTGFHVVVDGKESANFREIVANSLIFSADGKHSAYSACTNYSQCQIIVDGVGTNVSSLVPFTTRARPPIDFPSIFFSDDGTRMVYAWPKPDGVSGNVIIINGQEIMHGRGLFEFPAFSPDSKRFATMNWNGKTYALSVDGKAGPTYDDFLEVNRNVARFLDSHTYRFLGVKNGSVYRVVVDLGG